MGKGFRRDIDARIGELERLRDTLDGCIGCGCLSLERCALYNPGDGAAVLGADPRWLLGDSTDDLERPIDPPASGRRGGGAGRPRGAVRATSPGAGRRRRAPAADGALSGRPRGEPLEAPESVLERASRQRARTDQADDEPSRGFGRGIDASGCARRPHSDRSWASRIAASDPGRSSMVDPLSGDFAR